MDGRIEGDLPCMIFLHNQALDPSLPQCQGRSAPERGKEAAHGLSWDWVVPW